MSVVSGLAGAEASRKGSSQAAASQDKATAQQEEIYQQQREDFEPFRKVGVSAIDPYQKMLSGEYDMKESPAAQYQLQQGTKSLNRQLAARGLLGSGNAATRLADLSTGVASADYQQQYNRLSDALKLGTGAAGSMGQAGNQMSSAYGQAGVNQGNIAMNQGQNRANLYGGMAGAGANTAAAGMKIYQGGKEAGWWGGNSGSGVDASNMGSGSVGTETGYWD